MPYDAKAIANFFIQKANAAGKPLTHMQVQKLTYIAHGWHLAIANCALISSRIEAWQYGPVIPELYSSLRAYGGRPIEVPLTFHSTDGARAYDLDQYRFGDVETTRAILERVWEKYGQYSGPQLSSLTHADGTPWSVTRAESGDGGAGRPQIVDERIQAHYRLLATRGKQVR